MNTIIDISLPLSSDMPTYPGTASTTIETVTSPSGRSKMSVITMGSHGGTHVDAPSHSLPDGNGVDGYPLEKFYGPCRVLDLTDCEACISKADLEKHTIKYGERILLKTKNSLRGYEKFDELHIFLSSDGADYLAGQKIALVGIDALGIRKFDANDNTPHTALLSQGIPIIEGLDLSKAKPGTYILAAFPLAFGAIDGSPLRAVLIA